MSPNPSRTSRQKFPDPGGGMGGYFSVLPFRGERTSIANSVESNNGFLAIDVAVAGRPEIPVTARVREIHVAAKPTGGTFAAPPSPHLSCVHGSCGRGFRG